MRVLRDHKFITVCVIVAIVALILVLSNAMRTTDDDIKASEDAIKQTVQNRALQCYVIEKAYPESLSYLEENYGLAVNKEDYLIVYQLYAENQPPQIRVMYQGKK